MLQPPFGVVRDGEPIHLYPLKNSIRTGIDFNDVRVEFGLITEYEEREASAYAFIPWDRWETIDTRERAATVAHYRMHRYVSMHSQDAVEREQERRERAKPKGKR